MKFEMIAAKEVLLRIDRDELIILNNALNEACNGLGLEEFSTRMGTTRQEVRDVLEQISPALDRMEHIR